MRQHDILQRKPSSTSEYWTSGGAENHTWLTQTVPAFNFRTVLFAHRISNFEEQAASIQSACHDHVSRVTYRWYGPLPRARTDGRHYLSALRTGSNYPEMLTSVPFAILIASSSVLNLIKHATGPKISSLAIVISMVTSANTVGSMK